VEETHRMSRCVYLCAYGAGVSRICQKKCMYMKRDMERDRLDGMPNVCSLRLYVCACARFFSICISRSRFHVSFYMYRCVCTPTTTYVSFPHLYSYVKVGLFSVSLLISIGLFSVSLLISIGLFSVSLLISIGLF